MTLPSLDAARKSQRPYRYGMILLCVGALINWLGLAENYVEPVRYIGVACIIAGALLICAAMCCWLQRPAPEFGDTNTQIVDGDPHIHVIEVPVSLESTMQQQQKPPDYDSVADAPPCYEEAIKLNPSLLLAEATSPNVVLAEATSPSVLFAEATSSTMPRLQEVTVDSSHATPGTPPPPYNPAR